MTGIQWHDILLRASQLPAAHTDRAGLMSAIIDILWDALSPHGVSWIGFYLDNPQQPDALRLTLGPRRNTAACSPIGLHGACGRCLLSRRILVVDDVRKLGAAYIACDPRDLSECVVPCLQSDGSAWGVLDVDSHLVGHFTAEYGENLGKVITAAGLTV